MILGAKGSRVRANISDSLQCSLASLQLPGINSYDVVSRIPFHISIRASLYLSLTRLRGTDVSYRRRSSHGVSLVRDARVGGWRGWRGR